MGADGALKLNFCSVGMDGMPGAAVRADMRGKLGFDPVHSDDTSDLYAFSEHDGSRDPFKGEDVDAVKKAGTAGKLSLVVVVGEPANVSIVYAVATGAGK